MQNKETRHVLLRVLFVQLQLSFSHLNTFIHKSVLPTYMLKKIKSTIITRTITAMKKMYFLCIFVYLLITNRDWSFQVSKRILQFTRFLHHNSRLLNSY